MHPSRKVGFFCRSFEIREVVVVQMMSSPCSGFRQARLFFLERPGSFDLELHTAIPPEAAWKYCTQKHYFRKENPRPMVSFGA